MAFAQLTAMYKSLEPIANQLKKLDVQMLDTFHPDFEEEERKSEAEEEAQGYEEKVMRMEAYYVMLEDNRQVTVEVKINT